MTRAIVLAAVLCACAPTYALTTRRTPPVYLFAADMLAFSVGSIVGLSQFNARPEQRDDALMWTGFGAALIPWASYWVVDTN